MCGLYVVVWLTTFSNTVFTLRPKATRPTLHEKGPGPGCALIRTIQRCLTAILPRVLASAFQRNGCVASATSALAKPVRINELGCSAIVSNDRQYETSASNRIPVSIQRTPSGSHPPNRSFSTKCASVLLAYLAFEVLMYKCHNCLWTVCWLDVATLSWPRSDFLRIASKRCGLRTKLLSVI